MNLEQAKIQYDLQCKQEYKIKMENGLGKELSIMYNLSEAVEEKGIETGIEQGIKQGRLETLFSLVHDKVLKSEEAARRADMSKEEFVTINEQISNFAQTYPTNLKASSNEALLFMRRYRFANCSCFSCCFKDAYPSSNVQ